MGANNPTSKLMVDTPLSTVRDNYTFFHTPANIVQIRFSLDPQ